MDWSMDITSSEIKIISYEMEGYYDIKEEGARVLLMDFVIIPAPKGARL